MKAGPPAGVPAVPEAVGPYLAALVAVVLLDLGLRLRILEHYLQAKAASNPLLDGLNRLLLLAFALQCLLFMILALRHMLPRLWQGTRLRRQQLRLLAGLASGLTLLNLISENVAIYRLNLESYSLMLESLVLYLSVTLLFLFWYWYIDHPPRHPGPLWQRAPQDSRVSMPYGIVFPEEMLERDLLASESWRPAFSDYLYFTILSSNCFGPPEGHSLVGTPIKTLHVLHSLSMLSVFIVILARAINTLS